MNKRSNTIARAVNIDQKAICCDGIGTHEVIIADCNFGIDSIFFFLGLGDCTIKKDAVSFFDGCIEANFGKGYRTAAGYSVSFGQIRCDSPECGLSVRNIISFKTAFFKI